MRLVGLGGQPRFFYGWVIVAVLSATGGWTLAMGGANVGFFVNPIRGELGFDQATFGWANTARMVLGAASGIVIGRILDRYGPRFLLAITGGLAGLLIISLGYINHEWQLVAVFGVLGMLGMQGSAPIYTSPTVAKWFVRLRPKAMGMLYLGTPIALMIAFPLTQWLIGEFGWRNAWMILGSIGFALVVPTSLIFLRRQPEDLGLQPDGDQPPVIDEKQVSGSAAAPSTEAAQEYPWTRAEALRTAAFWRLTSVFALQMFASGSLSIYRFPHMIGNDISPQIVSYAASAEGAIAIIPAFFMGPWIAAWGLRRVGFVSFQVFALGVALIIIAFDPVSAFAATMTWGLGISFAAMLQNVYYPAFFGRRHIGAIRGVSMTVALTAGAIAGPLTGYVGDLTGNFAILWWPSVAGLVLSGIILATTRQPRQPASTLSC